MVTDKEIVQEIKVAQMCMDSRMLGISFSDRVPTLCPDKAEDKHKTEDIGTRVATLEWR